MPRKPGQEEYTPPAMTPAADAAASALRKAKDVQKEVYVTTCGAVVRPDMTSEEATDTVAQAYLQR